MMNSLVGYGVSSESEEEEETQRNIREITAVNEENDSKQKKSHNFLLESGSASSESSSESEDERDEEQEPSPASVQLPSELPVLPTVTSPSNKLPSPALGGFGVLAGSSVFANRFKEQTDQKLSALQKHVPLTAQARPTHIDGKRICVAYRKDGRCRFGIRCKFAHDSDLQRNIAEPSASDSDVNNAAAAAHTVDCNEQAVERDTEDDEGNQNRRKKHRVGVSDGLIPPKRALKQYAKQRDNASRTHT